MIKFFLSLLIAPAAIAHYGSSSLSVAMPEEQYEKPREELTQQNNKIIYKENKNDPDIKAVHGSYSYLSEASEVSEAPITFSVVTDSDTFSFLKKKNKQIAATGFLQLGGSVMFKQKAQGVPFLEYISIITSKFVAAEQKIEQSSMEEKRKFVQITEGCVVTVGEDCVVVRSGAGDEFEELYKLRVNTLLEIDEIVENDDGEIWYKIKHEEDIPHPDRIKGTWFVPDTHVSVIEVSEESVFDPNKKIVIDISEQKIRTYESDELIMEEAVSTGLHGRHATPIGEFSILRKLSSRYMQAPSPGIADWYDLPGVPYVMYFTDSGDAIHCAYWHDKFGRQWSHGCVNTSCETARLLYEWTATGTKMIVQW